MVTGEEVPVVSVEFASFKVVVVVTMSVVEVVPVVDGELVHALSARADPTSTSRNFNRTATFSHHGCPSDLSRYLTVDLEGKRRHPEREGMRRWRRESLSVGSYLAWSKRAIETLSDTCHRDQSHEPVRCLQSAAGEHVPSCGNETPPKAVGGRQGEIVDVWTPTTRPARIPTPASLSQCPLPEFL